MTVTANIRLLQIHPFTAIPLFLCAEFAQGRKAQDHSFQILCDTMDNSLRSLSAMNLLAETCLAKFNSVALHGHVDVSIEPSPAQ
jgi:hypothetical protein